MHARNAFALLTLALTAAVSAQADPIHYRVDTNASNVQVTAASILSLDASPDITTGYINGQQGHLPFNSAAVGGSNTIPHRNSYALAEPFFVNAIPDELLFDEFELRFDNLPGPVGAFYVGTSLAGMGIAPGGDLGLPFSIVETPLILFLANVSFTSMSIVLEEPFSSPLIENPAIPGQYQWAGAANVTLSGEIKPGVDVSPTNPEPVPFEIPISAFPLAGSFDLVGTDSEIVVGLEAEGLQDLLENQSLEPDPISQRVEIPIETLAPTIAETLGPLLTALQLDGILDQLGESIFVDVTYQTLIGFDANAFEVHYLPEPSGPLGLGLGFALLAAVRRMRAMSS